MARLRDIFENFRQTAARRVAAFAVQREERNLAKRLKRWESKQMPGIKAFDPRRRVNDMNTNQLKAYARELNRMRGKAIHAAGIATESGELLDLDTYNEYAELWRARENEKQAALRSLKLKGVPQNPKIALADIDPTTGLLKPERGGNYVLQLYGDVQIPSSKAALERRIESMHKWKRISARIEQSNDNVRAKLGVISPYLVGEWDKLNTAQKQFLINNAGIFDLLNAFTFTTKVEEVRAYLQQFPELAESQFDELQALIVTAGSMEQEFPERQEA